MSDAPVKLYEGLFLLNQAVSGSDFGGSVDHVRDILTRAEAEIIVLRKWDERRLAYEIKGQKRGLFLLAIFNARPAQIANIERDCNLSEIVVRAMMIRGDHLGETEMELAKRETSAAEERALREERARDEESDIDTASVPSIDEVDDVADDDSSEK